MLGLHGCKSSRSSLQGEMGFEIPHILSGSVSVDISHLAQWFPITHARTHLAWNIQIHSHIYQIQLCRVLYLCNWKVSRYMWDKDRSQEGYGGNCDPCGDQSSSSNCLTNRSRGRITERVERQKKSETLPQVSWVWTPDDPVVFTQVVLELLLFSPPCQTSFLRIYWSFPRWGSFVDKQNIS